MNIEYSSEDVLTYSVILFFIFVLSWLSNREIRKSLDRARDAGKALTKERDLLEIKVAERTAEISQIAEFGKLSQGLFHDLMTPLSSVALHMEKLQGSNVEETKEARTYIEKAVIASHKMGNFMNHIRDHIRHSGATEISFKKISIRAELHSVIELLKYKAREANVSIQVKNEDDIFFTGNPIHFQRIFLNLISNAIEAHENDSAQSEKIAEKIIDIDMQKSANTITIIISDNGPGIPVKNIQYIFDPFFTTKSPHKGIGIGLSTVKNIVEKDLNGTIRAESENGDKLPKSEKSYGSRFIISFPASTLSTSS